MIDKGVCDKGYAWNPYNCECDKSCDFGEYLDYENCKCRKRLVEECNENIDEEKLTELTLFEHKNGCTCYYAVFIVLGVIALAVSIAIDTYFVHYKYMNQNKENVSIYDYVYHAKKKGVNKYLIFDSVDENKGLLKKYNDVWNRFRGKIKEISCGEHDYEKDYMKIKFNYDDNLPLSKPLNCLNVTITIRFVFKEDGKLYPQVFLHDTLFELNI